MADIKKKIKKLLGKVEDPELKQELESVLEREESTQEDISEDPVIAEPEENFESPKIIPLPEEALIDFRELQQKSIRLEHLAGSHYLTFHKNMQPIREEMDNLMGLFEENKEALIRDFTPVGEEGEYTVSLSEDGSSLVLVKKETE